RIGVDAEQQKLARQGAEVDDAIDQRFRRIAAVNTRLGRQFIAAGRGAGSEQHVDRLIDGVLDRFEANHASLPDLRLHPPANMDAAAATGEVEFGPQKRQIAQTRQSREAPAHLGRRFDDTMQTTGGDFIHGHRYAPGLSMFLHEFQTLPTTRATIAGSGKCTLPPAICSAGCAAKSRTASRMYAASRVAASSFPPP